MDFINLLIVILALSSTPITNVALSPRKGVPPLRQQGEYISTDSKGGLICKLCKRLSERRTCCFNYTCVDLVIDRFNCGNCGLICKHGTRCCGGICVDIKKDHGNCGKCYNVCSPGQNCSFGLCGNSYL
ncbi:unnamed protein product [Withania somnifera]